MKYRMSTDAKIAHLALLFLAETRTWDPTETRPVFLCTGLDRGIKEYPITLLKHDATARKLKRILLDADQAYPAYRPLTGGAGVSSQQHRRALPFKKNQHIEAMAFAFQQFVKPGSSTRIVRGSLQPTDVSWLAERRGGFPPNRSNCSGRSGTRKIMERLSKSSFSPRYGLLARRKPRGSTAEKWNIIYLFLFNNNNMFLFIHLLFDMRNGSTHNGRAIWCIY